MRILWVTAFLTVEVCAQTLDTQPIYQDPEQPISRRVEDLLGRMTLEEKVGQMNMPCLYVPEMGKSLSEKQNATRQFTAGKYVEGLGPAGGYFTLANTILHEGPHQQALFFNELQRMARDQTRLGIPLLQTEEGTHGLMCSGGTIFPEGPALGSTWNLDLIREVYAVAAREARAVGIHQLYTLVVEPIRDPRLGRNEEAYSEDPFLCARIAETIVEGVQGTDLKRPDKVVAGLCHFPGQSQPVSGLEKGAMEISERMLREVFLPPWEAGIKRAGALGVMATYPSIDGEPVHGSEGILTDLLRDELSFEGLVLSEGGGFETLIWENIVATQKEAGALALKAGVDVGISFEPAFMRPLIENVREGKVPVGLIDRAVRRILAMKFRLGLFENPFVDPEHARQIVHSTENQDLALEAAREGIVLLKNEGSLLPLKKNLASIAVIGPNADHARNQLGDYTAKVVLQDVITVLEGVRDKVSPQTVVKYQQGCDIKNEHPDEIKEAIELARDADVAIVVVGENEWSTLECSVGEACDAATLELPGRQEELVRAVFETGTPTVVVLINGRPLATPWIAENIPAVVEAWIPGEKGGQAIAEILFGDINPSGRLPVTIPRHAGQLPVYYNAKPSKRYWIEHGWRRAYTDLSPYPLYPFGHGLSYTTFEYSDLRIDREQIRSGESVTVSVRIENSGNRRGSEVVQLYLDDVLSSMATPVMELRGFKKLNLEPGEQKTVVFELSSDELSMLDKNLRRIVEPGKFDVMIGHSSQDIRLRGSFEVTE